VGIHTHLLLIMILISFKCCCRFFFTCKECGILEARATHPTDESCTYFYSSGFYEGCANWCH